MDVRILHAAAQRRMVRVESAAAEFIHRTVVQESCQFVIFQHFDFLHFMGSPEPVKEIQERHPAFDRRQMGDRRQIHHLLHAAFGQHGEAGLPRRHHVGMVAENADCIGADDPGADMEYAGQQLAGDFVHVGNHQQKSLRGGVGRRQRAGLQRAVHSTRRAAFRLHFHHLHGLAENVLAPLRRPFIDILRHVGRRRNRKDCRHIGERVRNVCGRRVSVHCLHFPAIVLHQIDPPVFSFRFMR